MRQITGTHARRRAARAACGAGNQRLHRLGPLMIALAVVACTGVAPALKADDGDAELRPAGSPILLVSYGDIPGSDTSIGAATDSIGGLVLAGLRGATRPAGGVVEERVFDAQGRPLGPIVRLRVGTGEAVSAAVARNARGDFVVWGIHSRSAPAHCIRPSPPPPRAAASLSPGIRGAARAAASPAGSRPVSSTAAAVP
jgi:hypothetical protein